MCVPAADAQRSLSASLCSPERSPNHLQAKETTQPFSFTSPLVFLLFLSVPYLSLSLSFSYLSLSLYVAICSLSHPLVSLLSPLSLSILSSRFSLSLCLCLSVSLCLPVSLYVSLSVSLSPSLFLFLSLSSSSYLSDVMFNTSSPVYIHDRSIPSTIT